MKRYDYVERVLMSAVLCDAATEISLGNKRGLRSAWQLVLNLGEKKRAYREGQALQTNEISSE